MDQEPMSIHVRWSDWKGGFDTAYLQSNYKFYRFEEKSITFADLGETLLKANELLRPYRGALSKKEKRKNIILLVALIVFLIIGLPIGVSTNKWFWPFFFTCVFIGLAITLHYYVKLKANNNLRMSQFLLAVFCRAENNRLYLNQGVELRPGYLAKWIEISVMDLEEHADVLTYIKSRTTKPSLER